MSILRLSEVFDIDRAVVERWVKKCSAPVDREGQGRGKGLEWELSLPALWVWWGEHNRKLALAEAGVGVAMDPQDKLALLKLAREAKLVTPNVVVEELLTRVMSEVRQALTALPGRMTREMQGFPTERVRGWKLLAQGVVRETLDGMRKTLTGLDLSASEDVAITEDDAGVDAQT